MTVTTDEVEVKIPPGVGMADAFVFRNSGGEELLRLDGDGTFRVRGRCCTEDGEVVDALREFTRDVLRPYWTGKR